MIEFNWDFRLGSRSGSLLPNFWSFSGQNQNKVSWQAPPRNDARAYVYDSRIDQGAVAPIGQDMSHHDLMGFLPSNSAGTHQGIIHPDGQVESWPWTDRSKYPHQQAVDWLSQNGFPNASLSNQTSGLSWRFAENFDFGEKNPEERAYKWIWNDDQQRGAGKWITGNHNWETHNEIANNAGVQPTHYGIMNNDGAAHVDLEEGYYNPTLLLNFLQQSHPNAYFEQNRPLRDLFAKMTGENPYEPKFAPWSLGNFGKGIIDENGQAHHWATDLHRDGDPDDAWIGNPHHQTWETQNSPARSRFYIFPNGQVDGARSGFPGEAENDIGLFSKSHPDFWHSPEEQFNFSKRASEWDFGDKDPEARGHKWVWNSETGQGAISNAPDVYHAHLRTVLRRQDGGHAEYVGVMAPDGAVEKYVWPEDPEYQQPGDPWSATNAPSRSGRPPRVPASQDHPQELDDWLKQTNPNAHPVDDYSYGWKIAKVSTQNSKLWVDDERRPPDMEHDWARNVPQARVMMSQTPYQHVSLDHDLGTYITPWGGQGFDANAEDGADLADWMVAHHNIPPSVHIHSANPQGAVYMYDQLSPHTNVTMACAEPYGGMPTHNDLAAQQTYRRKSASKTPVNNEKHAGEYHRCSHCNRYFDSPSVCMESGALTTPVSSVGIQSLSVDMNQNRNQTWTLGNYGKGLVDTNGDIHHWNVKGRADELSNDPATFKPNNAWVGAPHHGTYEDAKHILGQTYFFMDPSGEVERAYDSGYPGENDYDNFIASHPDFHQADSDQWNFSSIRNLSKRENDWVFSDRKQQYQDALANLPAHNDPPIIREVPADQPLVPSNTQGLETRRPYYYDPYANEVVLGPHGVHHADIEHHLLPRQGPIMGYGHVTGNEVGTFSPEIPQAENVNRAVANYLGPKYRSENPNSFSFSKVIQSDHKWKFSGANWQPGNEGKGFVTPSGEVHNWSTQNGKPFHDHYVQQNGLQWPEYPEGGSWYVINPDGASECMERPYPTPSNKYDTDLAFASSHPSLYMGRNSPFSFSKRAFKASLSPPKRSSYPAEELRPWQYGESGKGFYHLPSRSLVTWTNGLNHDDVIKRHGGGGYDDPNFVTFSIPSKGGSPFVYPMPDQSQIPPLAQKAIEEHAQAPIEPEGNYNFASINPEPQHVIEGSPSKGPMKWVVMNDGAVHAWQGYDAPHHFEYLNRLRDRGYGDLYPELNNWATDWGKGATDYGKMPIMGLGGVNRDGDLWSHSLNGIKDTRIDPIVRNALGLEEPEEKPYGGFNFSSLKSLSWDIKPDKIPNKGLWEFSEDELDPWQFGPSTDVSPTSGPVSTPSPDAKAFDVQFGDDKYGLPTTLA